jgi:D-alanyl-D-alanine carboxypeptidase
MVCSLAACNREIDIPSGSNRTEQQTSPDTPDNLWALRLVNARNPLPHGFEPELALIGHSDGAERFLDSRAAPYAIAMISAAADDGITLIPRSAYRNLERQNTNFRDLFQQRINAGDSPQEAFEYTASWIAPPGTSEHNAGTAIDFNLIEERFDQTAEFRWLSDNAHRFGFILRYAKDTRDITGIHYEPWHFTFVGVYHAGRILESGLTLEEYIDDCAEDDSVVEALRQQLAG